MQKTQILKNPLDHLKTLCPDASTEKIAELSKLHQLYYDVKKQHAEKQINCKKTSREIGEAKRKGLSAEQLIQSMQKKSAAVKKLQSELDGLADTILNHFEPAPIPNDSKELPISKPVPRSHSDHPDIDEHVTISLLADEYKAWNQYVESNPVTSIYYRAEWKDLLGKTFGHQCCFFYASYDDDIVGVLPLVRLKSRLFGDFMVSMPYFNSGGAIANTLSIENKLIQAANSQAEQLGIEHIEYRDDISRDDFPSKTEKVNMILPLPDSHEILWNTFTSKLRSQVKRSQLDESRVSFGQVELLDDFYTVFARNMRDLGTPVYGKSFFRNILKKFPEHSKIIVIHMNNRPVAAGFLMGYKDNLEIPWASTIKDVNHLSINMHLYWEVLKFAIDKQYHYFDFGRSSLNSGTFRFKQQWGAMPKQLYWHYWLPENAELPSLNPNNPKYTLAINIWKRLPVFITKILGPFIVRNIP